MSYYSLSHLSDETLLHDLNILVSRERKTIAELLAHLAEVDARRLYLPSGYSSMHAYCEQELRLSEAAANKRIRVARKAREIPALFGAIADGRLNLNGVVLLASSLTPQNAQELIAMASGKSRFEIERLVAERSPRSETMPMVVHAATPAFAPVAEVAAEPVGQLAARPVHVTVPRPKVVPIARDRYDVTFSIGQDTHDKLQRAEVLLGHTIPNGDLATTLDRVLDLAIALLEKKKFGAGSKRPMRKNSSNSRYVPAQVRRAVWQRDEGRCTFVSKNGHTARRARSSNSITFCPSRAGVMQPRITFDSDVVPTINMRPSRCLGPISCAANGRRPEKSRRVR